VIDVRRAAAAVVNLLTFVLTVLTTLIVIAQMGNFWGLLWFTVPIGAMAYLKARFCPLDSKHGDGR
jgi:hypothetical protein